MIAYRSFLPVDLVLPDGGHLGLQLVHFGAVVLCELGADLLDDEGPRG